MVFLLLTIRIITSWVWINFIIGVLIVTVINCAISESIKSEVKNI